MHDRIGQLANDLLNAMSSTVGLCAQQRGRTSRKVHIPRYVDLMFWLERAVLLARRNVVAHSMEIDAMQKSAKPVLRAKTPRSATTATKRSPVKAIKTKRQVAAHTAASPAGSTGNQQTSSKQAQIVALLSSKEGATMAALIELTGWQAHTVHGTISGALRKKLRLNIQCPVEGDRGRVYRIVGAAA